MEDLIELILEHPIISAAILLIASSFILGSKENTRKYNSAKDFNKNLHRDTRGYINRENSRRYQATKDNSKGTLVLFAIFALVGYAIYKFFFF